jgi:hypothetical protein
MILNVPGLVQNGLEPENIRSKCIYYRWLRAARNIENISYRYPLAPTIHITGSTTVRRAHGDALGPAPGFPAGLVGRKTRGRSSVPGPWVSVIYEYANICT